MGRASLHMGAPTSLSWAPQGGGSRALVPGPPSPSLLPKEGVCLPCPLLLQPHCSLNPELSERPPDSPGPHLISLGTQLNLSKAIGEEFILSP